MENTPFIGDFPIETTISSGFPVAALDCRRVDQRINYIAFFNGNVSLPEANHLLTTGTLFNGINMGR